MEVLQTIKTLAALVWSFPGVQIITALTLLNVDLAVAVSIKTDSFTLRELGAFLYRHLLPYVITYATFALIANGTGFQGVATAVLALIVAALGARIIDNLGELGVPIPPGVLKLVQAGW